MRISFRIIILLGGLFPLFSSCSFCKLNNKLDDKGNLSETLCIIEGQVAVKDMPQIQCLSGKRMMVFDEWDGHKLLASSKINRDGTFQVNINASNTTHVYLYVGKLSNHRKRAQFRDFILEPGTIDLSGDFSDESIFLGATGTPLNDKWQDFKAKMREQQNIELKRQLFCMFMSDDTEDELRLLALEQYTLPDSDIFFKENCYRLFKSLDKDLQNTRYQFETLEEHFQTISSNCSYFVPGSYYCNITGISLEGERKELSSYFNKGNYVLVDYWGTWCSSCIDGLPDIVGFFENISSGISLVGINVNEPLTLKQLSKFASEHEITWDIMVADNGAADFVRSFPTMALYNASGQLIHSGHPKNVIPEIAALISNCNK